MRDDVTRILRELKPDAVITFGPEGGTGHPDHRLVGERAYACHRSQYTAEQVAANMRYIDHAFRGQVFLRHWNGGAARTELLESGK